jgi:hypothetical protein
MWSQIVFNIDGGPPDVLEHSWDFLFKQMVQHACAQTIDHERHRRLWVTIPLHMQIVLDLCISEDEV